MVFGFAYAGKQSADFHDLAALAQAAN